MDANETSANATAGLSSFLIVPSYQENPACSPRHPRAGLAFADRGAHALKGAPGEWRLYAAG
jgi:hypothetical protein